MPFLGPGIVFKYERRRVVLKKSESYARYADRITFT